MNRFLRITAGMALGLGFILALPGLLLLIGASLIHCLLVDREHAAQEHALDGAAEARRLT